jgi:hypothetical protein
LGVVVRFMGLKFLVRAENNTLQLQSWVLSYYIRYCMDSERKSYRNQRDLHMGIHLLMESYNHLDLGRGTTHKHF